MLLLRSICRSRSRCTSILQSSATAVAFPIHFNARCDTPNELASAINRNGAGHGIRDCGHQLSEILCFFSSRPSAAATLSDSSNGEKPTLCKGSGDAVSAAAQGKGTSPAISNKIVAGLQNMVASVPPSKRKKAAKTSKKSVPTDLNIKAAEAASGKQNMGSSKQLVLERSNVTGPAAAAAAAANAAPPAKSKTPGRPSKKTVQAGLMCRSSKAAADASVVPTGAANTEVGAARDAAAPKARAATAIQQLQVMPLEEIDKVFLEHHLYLGETGVEKIVMRVLDVAAARDNSSIIHETASEGNVMQPEMVLANILACKPPLNIRIITALLLFEGHHPTLHLHSSNLLAALCGFSNQRFFPRMGLPQLSQILNVFSRMLPNSASASLNEVPGSGGPAIPQELHRACTEMSYKLVSHTTQLLERSTFQPSANSRFDPDSLAVVCAAAARLHISHPPFWDAAAQVLIRGSLRGGDPKVYGTVAWAFAATAPRCELFPAVLRYIADSVVEGDTHAAQPPKRGAQLLAAFGKAHFHHQALFDNILGVMTAKCEDLDVKNLSSVMQACAHVGHDALQLNILLQSLATSPVWQGRLASDISQRFAANILWSLAVMDLLLVHPRLVSQLLFVYRDVTSPDQLDHYSGQQLAQVHASLTRLGSCTYGLPSRTLLAQAASARCEGKRQSSKMQEYVVRKLTNLIGSNGVQAVQEEAQLMDGLLSVDVLVTLEGGRRVVVEVDGSPHYLLNDRNKVDGSTLWRNNMLAYELGGRHNLICLEREDKMWWNYITGKIVEDHTEPFLLAEVQDGGRLAV